MDDQELNKKLAEWAGFICHWEEGATDSLWHYPDEPEFQMRKEIPDFTQSLDACFKWLVPKILRLGLTISHTYPQFGNVKWTVDIVDAEIEIEAETPALALCLAIEKLIDGGIDEQAITGTD